MEMHPENISRDEIVKNGMARVYPNDLTLEEYINKVIDKPPDFSKWSIYRIPKRLLNMNRKAYIPEVVSIGPFHHGRRDLMATEPLKIYCLNNYLRRIEYTSEEVWVKAEEWDSKARNWYAEPIKMKSKDFVRMMLMDGCFIIELLIIAKNNQFAAIENGFDRSFFKAIWFDINRDLIMLENQLPFFVLQDLFDLLPPEKKEDGISFIQIMEEYLSNELIGRHFKYNIRHQVVQVDHLIDLLGSFYIETPIGKTGGFLLPPTASELSKASIKVKRAKAPMSLLDISFQNGVLRIPPFEINNEFEFYVRNLMAFEHLRKLDSDSDSVFYRKTMGYKTKKSYVLDYIQFLDGLISTEEDVALLVKEKIITNHIGGSNKEVSQMFNNLCKYTPIPHDFYYNKMSKELHAYCKKWRHRSMATLKRDYFNSPWACISFVAATILILLTLLQTVFSGLSIPKN